MATRGAARTSGIMVPTYDSQKGIETGGPVIGRPTDVSSGLSALGDHMQKAALILAQEEDYYAHVEAANNLAQFKQTMLQKAEENKLAQKGYTDTFTNDMQATFNDVAKQFSSGSRSRKVQDYFDLGASNWSSTFMKSNIQWQHNHNRNWAMQSITDRAALVSQQIYGDAAQFRGEVGQMQYDIRNLPGLDQAQRKSLEAQVLNSYTMNMFRGIIDRDPTQALSMLTDNEQFGQLAQIPGFYLDKEDRANLIHRAMSETERIRSTEGAETVENLKKWLEKPDTKVPLYPGLTHEDMRKKMSRSQYKQANDLIQGWHSRKQIQSAINGMDTDKLLGYLAGISTGGGMHAETSKVLGNYYQHFADAAKEYGISKEALLAIATQESPRNKDGTANPLGEGVEIPGKGRAKGIMQIMPANLGGIDWRDPRQNIFKGAEIFSKDLRRAEQFLTKEKLAGIVDAEEVAMSTYNGGQHNALYGIIRKYKSDWKEHIGEIKRSVANPGEDPNLVPAKQNYDYIHKVQSYRISKGGQPGESAIRAGYEAAKRRETNPGDEADRIATAEGGSNYVNASLPAKVMGRMAVQRRFTRTPQSHWEGLTKGEASQLVAQLSAQEYEEAQQSLDQLKQQIMPDQNNPAQRNAWAAVQRSLYKNGLNKAYAFGPLFKGTQFEGAMSRAMQMKPEAAAQVLSDKTRKKEIDDAINNNTGDLQNFARNLRAANSSAGSTEYVNSFMQLLKSAAYVAAYNRPDASSEKIVEEMLEATIEKKVKNYEGYWIPRSTQGVAPYDVDDLNTRLERAMNYRVSQGGYFTASAPMTNGTLGAGYNQEELANARNLSWTNTPDGQGWVLTVKSRVTGERIPVLDDEGKQMIVSLRWLASDAAWHVLYR